ncbi:uncharacterized protein B0H18DRAFT_593656 [Fomitopsis serialis]|uniref:uncharacterized protein n=1 Tax=Fomitopsis serialis TaxID=139415 RepID=UPI002008BE94|nr:uncharacterized protein B0H18DRAFT_593656 [Neoantrodia serialis]KAH9920463.1 hypothetical protein B0H18DRAFT_593656 [Neoantrodia serialis]
MHFYTSDDSTVLAWRGLVHTISTSMPPKIIQAYGSNVGIRGAGDHQGRERRLGKTCLALFGWPRRTTTHHRCLRRGEPMTISSQPRPRNSCQPVPLLGPPPLLLGHETHDTRCCGRSADVCKATAIMTGKREWRRTSAGIMLSTVSEVQTFYTPFILQSFKLKLHTLCDVVAWTRRSYLIRCASQPLHFYLASVGMSLPSCHT